MSCHALRLEPLEPLEGLRSSSQARKRAHTTPYLIIHRSQSPHASRQRAVVALHSPRAIQPLQICQCSRSGAPVPSRMRWDWTTLTNMIRLCRDMLGHRVDFAKTIRRVRAQSSNRHDVSSWSSPIWGCLLHSPPALVDQLSHLAFFFLAGWRIRQLNAAPCARRRPTPRRKHPVTT